MDCETAFLEYGFPLKNDGCLPFYAIFSDVDTPEPDEKSIITYVSQLYDVFPEPPPGHPLFDVEAQKRLQQFRDLASSLHQWIKEQIVVMQVSKNEKMSHLYVPSPLKICFDCFPA